MDIFTDKIGRRLLQARQHLVEMRPNALREIGIDSFQFLKVYNQRRRVSVPVVLNVLHKLLNKLTCTERAYIIDIHALLLMDTFLLLFLIRTTGQNDGLHALFQILRKLLLDRI